MELTIAHRSSSVKSSRMIENLHRMPWLRQDSHKAEKKDLLKMESGDKSFCTKKTDEDYFSGTREEKKGKKVKKRKEKPLFDVDYLNYSVHASRERVGSGVRRGVIVESEYTQNFQEKNCHETLFNSATAAPASETVWSASARVADILFPNVKSVRIDRMEEEEMLSKALAESIATMQLEQFKKNSPEKISSSDDLYKNNDDDDDGWDNVQRNLPIDTECTNLQRIQRDTFRRTCRNDNNSSKVGILRNKGDGSRHSIASSEDLDFCFKKCSDSCDEEMKTPRSGKSVAFGESVTVEVIDDEIDKSDDEPNPPHKEANKISKSSKREPIIDKFGRVDGYSERRLFMGKGARMKEQLYIQNKTSELNPEFQNEEDIVKKPKSVVNSSRAGNSESRITREVRKKLENNLLDREQKTRTNIGEDIDDSVEKLKTTPPKSNSEKASLEQNLLDKNSDVRNSVETSNSSSSVLKFVKETSTIKEAIESKVCGFEQMEDEESILCLDFTSSGLEAISSCEKDIETVKRDSKIESVPREDNFEAGPFYFLNLEKKTGMQNLTVENSDPGGDIATGLQASHNRGPPGFEIQNMNTDYGYQNSNYYSECQIYQNNSANQISSDYSYESCFVPGYYDVPKHLQTPNTEHAHHVDHTALQYLSYYNNNHSAGSHYGVASAEEANGRGLPPQINHAKSLRANINAEINTNQFMTAQPAPGFIRSLRLPPGFTNRKSDISQRNFSGNSSGAENYKTRNEKLKSKNSGENDRKVDIDRNFEFGENFIPVKNCAADRSKPVDNTGMNVIGQTRNDNYLRTPEFHPPGMCSKSLQNIEYIPRYPTTTHCRCLDQYSAGSYEVLKWQVNPNFMNSPEFRASSMSEYSPPMPNQFGSSVSANPVFPQSMIGPLSYTDYNCNQPTQVNERSVGMFSNVEVGRGRGRLTQRDLI